MIRRWRATIVVSCVVGMLLPSACSNSDAPSDSEEPTIGYSCESDRDCGRGFCLTVRTPFGLDSTCTLRCESDAECSATYRERQCASLADGSKACVDPCRDLFSPPGFVCQGGVPVACETAGEQFCEDCGCLSDQRCKVGVGCLPLSDVGEECTQDSDCRTNNCSTFAGVCRVPSGSACNPDNCDLCLVRDSGWSYCSRDCTAESECGGGHCLGNSGAYHCQPPCSSFSDPSCPGDCGYPAGTADFLYCRCSDCDATAPLRPPGAPCKYDSHCTTGSCYSYVIGCAPFEACSTAGFCSASCVDTSSCVGGLVCADVPCLENETGTCGRKCLPRCDSNSACGVGFCRQLETGEGAVAVCDVKKPDIQPCRGHSDCQSGRCVAERCAPLAGLQNGDTCTLPADCQSGNCTNAQCRGTALIGDACGGAYDCAAGQCCTVGENAGHCAVIC